MCLFTIKSFLSDLCFFYVTFCVYVKICSSVARLCLTLSDPTDCSTPHFPVLYHVPELAQSYVHWVGDAIQPSHPLLSPLFLPSIFPSIRVFSKSRLFASGGQSVGASASASVLPKSFHGWFPLGLTGLISGQLKGLSKVFSNTTGQKHQFSTAQPSLWSNSHNRTWPLEKP